jgi:hypothetical protein
MAKQALCIGINDYPGTDSDLSGCVNDAHDWKQTLESRGFDVSTLLDAQATKAAMSTAIADLIKDARSGDTLAITYSGHGTWVPDSSDDETDGRDEALCPHDIRTAGPLLDDDLHDLLRQRQVGVRILLLSDSCHSGTVTRGDDSDLDADSPRARYLPLAAWLSPNLLPARSSRPTILYSGMARAGGDLLLAGCKDTEYSWDTRFNGRPNGAFTHYARKTLATLPADATYETWFRAIGDYLPSTRLPQTPQMLGAKDARRFKIFD